MASNIPTYENPDVRLQPSDLGITSFERAAARQRSEFDAGGEAIAGGIRELGDAGANIWKTSDEAASHGEIANGVISLAQMQAKHIPLFDDAVAKAAPGDVSAATGGAMINSINPEGQQFLDQFKTVAGRQWAEKAISEYQAGFIRKAQADTAAAAGQNDLVAIHQAVNSSVALAMAHPDSLEQLVGTLRTSVNGIVDSSNASEEAKAHLKGDFLNEQISNMAHAAVAGTMDKDVAAGQALQARFEKEGLLNPNQAFELNNYARVTNRANAADARTADELARRAADDARQARASHVFGMMYDENGQFAPPDKFAGMVARDDTLHAADKVELINAYQREATNGGKIVETPGLLSSLANRIGTDDPPTQMEIIKHVGTDLTNQNADFLLAHLNAKTPEDKFTMDMFNSVRKEAEDTLAPKDLNSLSGGQTPAGLHAMNRFDTWFIPAYQQGLARGLTPQQLLSPDSPDYLLKNYKLQEFAPTGADAVRGSRLSEAAWAAGSMGLEQGNEPILKSIASAASTSGLPEGYRAEIISATRPGATTREGGPSNHADANAMDIQIFDDKGNKVGNANGDFSGQGPGTRAYEIYKNYAQAMRNELAKQHPELGDAWDWGGNFRSGADTYDITHFQIAPGRPRGQGTDARTPDPGSILSRIWGSMKASPPPSEN
jgi:hypothetical protein